MDCCCRPSRANVLSVTTTADPVVFTIDRFFSVLPADVCFSICIPATLMVNDNTNLASVSDGTLTVPFIDLCSGVQARYDQIFDNIRRRGRKGCGCPATVPLRVFKTIDPTTGVTTSIAIKTQLCRSSFTPVVAVA